MGWKKKRATRRGEIRVQEKKWMGCLQGDLQKFVQIDGPAWATSNVSAFAIGSNIISNMIRVEALSVTASISHNYTSRLTVYVAPEAGGSPRVKPSPEITPQLVPRVLLHPLRREHLSFNRHAYRRLRLCNPALPPSP